jgi:hypothetical protein
MYEENYEIKFNGVDILVDFEYDRGTPKKLLRSRKPWDSDPEITEILKVKVKGSDTDLLPIMDDYGLDLLLTEDFFSNDI